MLLDFQYGKNHFPCIFNEKPVDALNANRLIDAHIIDIFWNLFPLDL